MTETPQVRVLDRSRSYSTVHGERPPGDPHAGVHFYQDGLPIDAQGFLVANHPDLQGDGKQATKLREIAERKLRKGIKQAKRDEVSETDAPVEVDEDDGEIDDDQPVNLEAWARGEQRVVWGEVTQAIARRFSRRVASKKDAIEFLVAEHVVAADQLSAEHQKLLRD